MWQAYLQSSEITDNGSLRNIIVFSDGTKKFSQEFIGLTSVKQLAKNRIAELEQSDIQLQTPVGLIDLTTTLPTKTPQDKFFEDYAKLQQLQQLVNLGIIDVTDKNYVSLLQTVKGEYNSTFFGI